MSAETPNSTTPQPGPADRPRCSLDDALSRDAPTSPPALGDRLLLPLIAALIGFFSIASLHQGWSILAEGNIECPVQPETANLRRIHLYVHAIGNLLSGACFLVVAAAQVLRAATPVRLNRMTQALLSGRFLVLSIGVLLVFWGYLLAEIACQALGTGRSDFLWFEGPDTVLARMRFYAHTIGITLIAASTLLFGFALLLRVCLPERRFGLTLYVLAPALAALLLAVACGGLCLLGNLLHAVF